MNFRPFLILLISLLSLNGMAQRVVRGTIVENDSTTLMPFVYIINKSNGNGTMSGADGKFSLVTNDNDTLICSYIGFSKLYMPVKDLQTNEKGDVKLIMKAMPINLKTVTVSTFKIKPYEREYMNDIIDRSKIRKMDYVGSPITSLYMKYSKEGKQINKLAKIFEDLMIEEQVQQKLSREILVKLTGDENIDYEAFRKYCYYVNNYYIITHEGFDLYSKVMECYKRYKREMGR